MMGKLCLFLNSNVQNCGVYQYGKRVFDILQKSEDVHYQYAEVSSLDEYKENVAKVQYDCIVYNYHVATMKWLTSETIQKEKKNFAIYHEFHIPMMFDYYIDTDCMAIDRGLVYGIPRPLLELPEQGAFGYGMGEKLKIGSFGLALPKKGFERIITTVNEQFNEAIINLHLPNSFYGDAQNHLQRKITADCKAIPRKEGIELNITHDFLDDRQLINFLRGNHINVFMYEQMKGRGLSSVIDYALSANRPIGISDSDVFRHIYSDDICLDKKSIREVFSAGSSLQQYREKWSNKNFIEKFNSILNRNL